MVDYARLTRTATKLIKKNGGPVTVQLIAEQALDDGGKPWKLLPLQVAQSYDTYGVFYPVTDVNVDGTLVRSEDFEVLLAADQGGIPSDFELAPRHRLADGTSTYAVLKSLPLIPRGPDFPSVILHAVVRRGT